MDKTTTRLSRRAVLAATASVATASVLRAQPSERTMVALIFLPRDLIAAMRRDWIRQIERAMAT